MWNRLTARLRYGTLIEDGARLKPVGRDAYDYTKDGRTVRVEVEMLSGAGPSRLVYASAIKNWLPPNQHEEITAAERLRIGQGIASYFTRHGISAEVE